MQRKNPLFERETDQVQAFSVDFEDGLEVINAAPALHSDLLLHADRCAQCRRRELQAKPRRLGRCQRAARRDERQRNQHCGGPDHSW